MKNLYEHKIIPQDQLKLGINTNPDNFRIKNSNSSEYGNFYTLGSNLRGELWESTAVNEIRTQAKQLTDSILSN